MIGSASSSNALSMMTGAAIQTGLGGLCGCANKLTGLIHHSTGEKGPVLLITHDAEWRPVFEPEGRRTVVTDRFFHPLAAELRRRGYEVCSASTAMPPYLRSLAVAAERGESHFSRHYLIDGFSNGVGLISRLEAGAHFNKIVETIHDDAGLGRMLVEFEAKKGERLKEILAFSFSRRYPDFVKRIDQAVLLLNKIKPSTVLIENEMGYFQRAVITAARSIGVPTVALQHGEISLTNPAYVLRGEDVCDKSESPTCMPIPDLTLVYGPRYKELLTVQSSFPPHRVIAVGNMQFDPLAGVDKHQAARGLRGELSIAPEAKLVLWTTQTHSWDKNEIESAASAMVNALSGLSGTQLIVKQHPMETAGHKGLLENKLRPLGSKAVFAPKERDIMTLISAADVVITKDSTTGLEALAAKKPLIVMNLSGLEDRVDYARKGAAIGVYRSEDLPAAINEALEGEGILLDQRQRYENDYLLKLDGKAAQRVADIVESFSGGITGG